MELNYLFKKIVLTKTEDQHPLAMVYEQELSIYGFQKNNLTEYQWYAKFSNKVDFGNAIGFTSQHEIPLE